MKICWFSNYPSPYKIKCMELLAKEYQILCVYEKQEDAERDSSWFQNDSSLLESLYLNKSSFSSIQNKLNDCDLLINGDYSSRSGRKILSYFKHSGKPCLLQADGGLAIPRGPLDLLISHEMRKYDGYLSSGEETDEYFLYYKVNWNRIYHYRFSSLTRKEIEKNKELSEHKVACRKAAGYQESFILFSAGQMIPRKGYDILAKAMVGMPDEIGVYIAGGEMEESVKKIIEENHLKHIHYIGYKQPEELSTFYAGADLFVLPTRYDIWGLVINEALSFGLPFITTDHCVAGLEFFRKALCGRIIPIDDPAALQNAILSLWKDPEKRKVMHDQGLAVSEHWSLEDMADDLSEVLSSFKRNL